MGITHQKKDIERKFRQMKWILFVFGGILVYYGFRSFVHFSHFFTENSQSSYPDPRVPLYFFLRFAVYHILIITILGLVFFFLKRWHRPGMYGRSVRILGWVLIGGYFVILISSVWTCFWGKICIENLIYFSRFYGYGYMPMLVLGLILLAMARSIRHWREMMEEHDLTV